VFTIGDLADGALEVVGLEDEPAQRSSGNPVEPADGTPFLWQLSPQVEAQAVVGGDAQTSLEVATIGHAVAMRYLVTGRHRRHKRNFYVDAPDLAVARSEALALAKF